MNRTQIRLVQASFEAVARQRNRTTAIFLAQVFVREPALRAVFRGELKAQAAALHSALAEIVPSLDRLYPIVPALEWLGVRAARCGVGFRQYDAVEGAMLAALADTLGAGFTDELRDAWKAAFRRVAGIMIAASEPELLAA